MIQFQKSNHSWRWCSFRYQELNKSIEYMIMFVVFFQRMLDKVSSSQISSDKQFYFSFDIIISLVLFIKYCIILFTYRMDHVVEGQVYKLFYLIDDFTNSVFQKVFICDKNTLKTIQHRESHNLKIYGLIGPVKQINNHLMNYYASATGQQKQNIKINFNNNLDELKKQQKAAVYLIRLGQNKSKAIQSTVFLALISNDDLYYKKPLNQSSLGYLLLRFIGDLCNDIIILYDDQIWNNFSNDCPYSLANNNQIQFTIQRTSVNDINIRKLKCQSTYMNYLSDQAGKIDYKNSFVISPNSHLQYFKKVDEKQLKARQSQSKKSTKQKMWRELLQNGNVQIELDNNYHQDYSADKYEQAILKLKNIFKQGRQRIKLFSLSCIKDIEKQVSKQQSKDMEQIVIQKILQRQNFQYLYYEAVLNNQQQFKIKDNSFIADQISQKIIENLSMKFVEIFQSIYPNNTKNLSQKTSQIKEKVQIQWKSCKKDLFSLFQNFFQPFEYLNGLLQNIYAKIQKIQVFKFDMIKVMKDSKIEKIEFIEEPETVIKIGQLKKIIPNITLSSIIEMKIFKTKFLRNCKLALVSRELQDCQTQEPRAQRKYQYTILSIERDQMRIIAKYQEYKLIFTFDEVARKVYLFKPSDKILVTFTLDDYQKSKNQKRLNLVQKQQNSNFEIISYSISKVPNERFYFIDSRKDTLYCYDITQQSLEQLYTEVDDNSKSLSCPRGETYQMVKAFNHNIFVALGNSQIINIFKVDKASIVLQDIVRSVECNANQVYLGMSTYSDEINEYLIIYQKHNFIALSLQNMSSSNMLRQNNMKVCLGNPIIDIFYEAKDRFGLYTTYTVNNNTPQPKQLHFHHILPNKSESEKLIDYLNESQLIYQYVTHSYYQNSQIQSIYERFGFKIGLIEFLNEAQTRIPIQICAVQYGNIIPLRDGNQIDNFYGQKGSIEQRCKDLVFGVVERLLLEEPKKKTIVVSVMGAQSTGKSYLMNRIFGTRFTVASCRTTIGIWMSLIKTQDVNFIALDCQGLFSVHRELNEEEKLIKILTGISDFTILNQNKSMANKSLTDLMKQISQSIKISQIKSKQLYNGSLVIVVRDVVRNQQKGIYDQFNQNFHRCKEIQDFMFTLFNKSNEDNSNFTLNYFPPFTQVQSFAKQTQKLRESFLKKSKDKQGRTSSTILKWLKIIMTQLSCDDVNLPQQVMTKINLQKVQQAADKAWRNGKQSFIFEEFVHKSKFTLEDTLVIIQQNKKQVSQYDTNCIQTIIKLFNQRVLAHNPINSVMFSEVYQELNQFIINFFNQRYSYAIEILKGQVKSLQNKNQKFKVSLIEKEKQIDQQIAKEKEKLKLCLNKCSEKEICDQICIKKSDHKTKIEQKKKYVNNKLTLKRQWLKKNKLTEQEQNDKNLGIKAIVEQCQQKLGNLKMQEQKFKQKQKLNRILQQQEQNLVSITKQIKNLEEKIVNNSRHFQEYKDAIKSLKKVLTIYIDYIQKLPQESDGGEQNYQEQIIQLKDNRDKIQNYLSQLQYLDSPDKQIQQTQAIQIFFEGMEDEEKHIEVTASMVNKQYKDMLNKFEQNQHQSSFIETKKIAIELQLQEEQRKIIEKIRVIEDKRYICKQYLRSIIESKQINEENKNKLEAKRSQANSYKEENAQFSQKIQIFNSNIENLKAITQHNKFNVKGINQFLIPQIMSVRQQKIQFEQMKKHYFALKEQLKQMFSRFDCEQQKNYNEKLNKVERLIKANCIKLKSKKNDKNQHLIQQLNKQNFIIQEIKALQIGLQNKMRQHNKKVQKLMNDLFQQEQYKQQKQFIKYLCLVGNKFYNNCQFRLENYHNFYEFDPQFAIRQNVELKNNWNEMIKSQYENDIQKFKTSLLATSQDELRIKIKQWKSEGQKIQSQLHTEQNEQKLQQLSEMLSTMQEKIQSYELKLEICHCLKINAIKSFQRCSLLLCQPQTWQQQEEAQQSMMMSQKQAEQNSTISQRQEIKKIRKQAINCLAKQLRQKNPGLEISLNDLSQIHKLGIDGEFSINLNELVEVLKSTTKEMQQKLYPQLDIEQLRDLQLQEQYIKNIRTVLRAHNQRYYHYRRYFKDISKLFKTISDKQKFPMKLLMKWDQQVEQNQKLVEQNQKNQHDVFFKALLTVIFEIFEIDSKFKKEYTKFQSLLKEQHEQYQKIKLDQSKYKQSYESLLSTIKQIQDQIDKLSTKIIKNQLQLEQEKLKIKQEELDMINIHEKIGQLKQKQQTKIKQFQEANIKLESLRVQLEISKNKNQVLSQIRQQLPNINYHKKIKGLIHQYTAEISENKQYKKQIQDEKKKAIEIQKKKTQIQESIVSMKKQLQQLNEKQIQQTINQIERRIKQMDNLYLKLTEIQKNQKQVKQLLNELKDYQKSFDNFCSCKTSHKCDMKCEVGCVDTICSGKGGHKGLHVCSLQSHRCNKKCQIDPRCNNGCQEMVNHSEDTRHKCSNTHKCKEKCKYCEKVCCVSQYQMHETHQCEETKCKKACILCGEECSSTDHSHDDEAEEIVRIKKLRNNEYEQRKQKLHLCGKQHKCESLCVYPGVCSNKFCNEKRPWARDGIVIEYQYVKQIQQKNQCTKIIPKGCYKHEEQCRCSVSHSCNHRCPDCRSLCYKSYNHSDTQRHQTKHRNQQFLIYAAQNEDQLIKVQSDNEQFIFNVGQESLPFKCDKSCERKGRGHFHLIQCPGGNNCYEKTIKSGAKHSDQIYKPHVDKKYDKLLCTQYWSLFNFQMPSSSKQFGLCNFACTVVQDHKNKQVVYCRQLAWHSLEAERKKHTFDCDSYHPKHTINAYQICFLIDATGSMADYITQSMKVIKAIVANVKKIQQKINVKFAVVAYRDHKVSESQLFRDLQKECVKKKQELSKQPEQQYHKSLMTQSAFEDKLLNLQKNYSAVKMQENFLQKFTEQEQFILKYHYPFVLDIQSSRRFLDENRRPNTMHYQLVRQYQKLQKKTLRQFIQSQLDYFISIMAQQVRQQQKINSQKWKLLQVQAFTTDETCIKFLQKLNAGGGGDPPEAVFDGMDATANLKWTVDNNTSRYIFHLFDAPPHGQKYDTNNEDYFPAGCPCGINLNSVINKLMRNKINYYIYPLTHRVKKTMKIFEDQGLKFKQQNIEKQNPKQFTDHVSSLICKQMVQKEIVVKK